MIHLFDDVPPPLFPDAGGKGGALAKLKQAGYPVPDGFVIFPAAFDGDMLKPEAWTQTRAALQHLRDHNGPSAFAVRSSALSEDSAEASFAGEFETVLDVKTDDEIRVAIGQVRGSRNTARVQAYSAAQGLAGEHEIAVVVQILVGAEFAGVIFTADPVTGSRAHMSGNYVHGLGDQLVSGEVNPMAFTLHRPGGQYAGPDELRRYAKRLNQLAAKLEDDLGAPQDIEWAVARGQVHLLQARPITTLRAYNPRTGEWNDSLAGDYLWTNSNLGEALPDVMTPLTWSLMQYFEAVTFPFPVPGKHRLMGNLGGRFYMNLSLPASLFMAMGMKRDYLKYESEEFFGALADDLEIPLIPFARWKLFQSFLPFALGAMRRAIRNRKRLPAFLAGAPARCAALRERIKAARTPAELLAVQNDLDTTYRETLLMFAAGTSGYENAYRPLRHQLRKLVGEEDTNTLLTGLSEGANHLASLGPVMGLAQVARGTLTPAGYADTYGHRGPHEFEVAWPRPAEDPAWVDTQLKSFRAEDVDALLTKQQTQREGAWARFTARHPREAARTQKKIVGAAHTARMREAIRSEVIRFMWAWREFALRAGAITGLGDDIFFLSNAEIMTVLKGDAAPRAFIPARRETHARYSALPQYPARIRGRFDPAQWAADPARRSDVFGLASPSPVESLQREKGPGDEGVRGFPGAAGVVEGVVRVIHSPEQGEDLQRGEVLVTVTTNVGWTPLFPRAAAIVTDVGAPLSHAAIVARELGIPAVVGCGNATMKLKTGDRVRVNGGRGTVEVL